MPELDHFREGLRTIAAEINPFQDSRQLQLELDERLHSIIKPAMRDLSVSIGELQRKSYLKLFELNPTLATAASSVVPVAFSAAAGAPVPVTLLVGGLGLLLPRLYDFVFGTRFEQRSKLESSPWAILFHLDKKMRLA
jgi:hypothetical protein